MYKKFFFFDIDGTLVPVGYTNSKIPDSALETLKQLREQGYFVSLATGRAEILAHGVREELGFENMVHDGGAGITIDNKIIEIEPINHEAVNDLVEQCNELGFPWGLAPDNIDYRLVPDNSFFEQTKDTFCPCVVKEGLSPKDFPQILKAYVACAPGEESKLEALTRLPWARFHKEYIFVEPTYKAVGIKKMVDHFGGNYKDVVVFGDAMNDLSMFIPEWTSIAMGNACEELKAKADYVTTDADQDGIYNACKHFGWVK